MTAKPLKILTIYIYKFFKEIKLIFNRLKNKDNHILILFRVQYENNDIATIGPLNKINIYNYIFKAIIFRQN